MTLAATTIADFILVQAIIFNAPLMRVKVEPLAAAPLASATAVTDFANDNGAAWTELAEIAPAMISVVELTPRFVKNFRNFSSARFTRIRAVSSLAPRAAP